MEVPADVNADKDHFQNTIRQKLGKELSETPWREDTNGQPLTKLERLSKTVKPAHEESWNTQERDIFMRLNEAAKMLEASQLDAKKDAALENSQVEDKVSPSNECVSCHQPVGHHLLKCSRDTLQQDLTEAVHKIPVEPLKAVPKVVHPFPGDSTKFQLMPPPYCSSQVCCQAEQGGQNENWPSKYKNQDVSCHHNNTPCDNSQIVPREDTVTHLLSLDPPP